MDGGCGGVASSSGGGNNGSISNGSGVMGRGGPAPDPRLEDQTREMVAVMGGAQPTEEDWRVTFRLGDVGGNISGEMDEKIMGAYRLVVAGFAKRTG